MSDSPLSLLYFIRYWQKCNLRQDRHASGCFPNDVSCPVLPQAAEHYGKCSAFLASFCSNEGAAGGRLRRRTSGLWGPGMTRTTSVYCCVKTFYTNCFLCFYLDVRLSYSSTRIAKNQCCYKTLVVPWWFDPRCYPTISFSFLLFLITVKWAIIKSKKLVLPPLLSSLS